MQRGMNSLVLNNGQEGVKRLRTRIYLLGILYFSALPAAAGLANSRGEDAAPHGSSFTTLAYEDAAFKLVLNEANVVARELRLPEKLPITPSDVVEKYIDSYGMARLTRAVGNISTSNYTYYVSVDNKFSYLESANQQADRLKWYREYSWPISRLDTNAAYQLATQWLTAVSMDVGALNRDCTLHIRPVFVSGNGTTERFLPLYWVYWTKEGKGHGSEAVIEVFLPAKRLIQLRVENTKYILRKPLRVPKPD